MATVAASPSAVSRREGWFFQFLKSELAPYRGRAHTVTRMTIAVVLTFILVMTFRIPNAAITLYTVFTVTREGRSTSVIQGLYNIAGVTAGIGLSILGALFFFDEPLLRFLFINGEFFLLFWLVRVIKQYTLPVNMGLGVYTAANIWTYPYPAEMHLEETLWVWVGLSLGVSVAVLVELILERQGIVPLIIGSIAERLEAVEALLTSYAETEGHVERTAAASRISELAVIGTGRLRRLVRSAAAGDPELQQYLSELSSAIALVGRLVDISANMVLLAPHPSTVDCRRLKTLAEEIARVRKAINERRRPEVCQDFQIDQADEIPLLPELEKTVSQIPQAFSPAAESERADVPSLIDQLSGLQLFVPDALTNRDYIRFAIKGCLAIIICHIIYTALDWPGIATSVLTCFVTALSTLGASQQKQILRLTGATFGGLLGIVCLVFIVPNIESITAITLLITAVSALSAWIVTSSPRLSYFGLQTALAFYLTTLQDYSAPTSLSPARDRFFGVLLGLTAMWVVNHLWPTRASDEMLRSFYANLRLVAQLLCAFDNSDADRKRVIEKIRNLRDLITAGFSDVQTHASTILFEFGPDRRKNLALREGVLKRQSSLRTLFLLEISILQYRIQTDPNTLPPSVRQARIDFDKAVSQVLESLAKGNETPDIEGVTASLSHYESELEAWLSVHPDRQVPTHAQGILSLTRQFVTNLQLLVDDMASLSENTIERGEQVPDQMLGIVR
jgi:multidrug resistance protein MdtO